MLMRKYFVYTLPDKDTKAVISGFSWAPFFFGPLWLAYKGLWVRALLILALLVILGGLGSISQQAGLPGLSLILSIVQFGTYTSLSFIGNEWIVKKLVDSGYLLVGIFDASSPDEAIEISKTANRSQSNMMKECFNRVEPTLDGTSNENINAQFNWNPQTAMADAELSPAKPKSITKRIGWTILKIVGIILLIIAGAVGSGIGKLVGKGVGKEIAQTANQTEKTNEKSLAIESAVNEMKQKIPMTLDGGVVLTDARAGDGYQIVYEYMIPSNIILRSDFKALQQANAKKTYCEKMSSLVSLGISAQWRYKHNSKEYVITETPLDCQPTKK